MYPWACSLATRRRVSISGSRRLVKSSAPRSWSGRPVVSTLPEDGDQFVRDRDHCFLLGQGAAEAAELADLSAVERTRCPSVRTAAQAHSTEYRRWTPLPPAAPGVDATTPPSPPFRLSWSHRRGPPQSGAPLARVRHPHARNQLRLAQASTGHPLHEQLELIDLFHHGSSLPLHRNHFHHGKVARGSRPGIGFESDPRARGNTIRSPVDAAPRVKLDIRPLLRQGVPTSASDRT